VTPAVATAALPAQTRRVDLAGLAPYLVFALCFATLLVRSFGRLQAPHLWAEDGTDFLPDALSGGWLTPFKQLEGYLHFFPRLVTQIALWFPIRAFPALTTTVWIATYSFSASLIARREYRELIPSDAARFFVGWAFCFLPGLPEMLGTLCNLHWALSMGLWLIAMKPASEPLKAWELAFTPITALSGGETIVLLPIFGWRAWSRFRARADWKRDGAAVALIAAVAVLNVFQKQHQPDVPPVHAADLLSALRHSVLNFFVYQPWLGPDGTGWLGAHTNRIFFALWGVLALAAAAVVLARRRSATELHLLLGVACWSSVVVLTMLVRIGAVEWFDHQSMHLGYFLCRYAFDLAVVALVFWVAVIRPSPQRRASLAAAAGFLVLNITVQLTSIPTIGPYITQTGTWEEGAAMLESALRSPTPQRVSFPIPPYGAWKFELDVKAR
jgi:hypothetical protein